MGAYRSRLIKGLPKTTGSICPVCKNVIEADIFERDGKVWMSKDCPEHGHFEDIYWSNAKEYLRAERFAYDGKGVDNPTVKDAKLCPADCGLCNLHLSHTSLANLDLTNRCNMNCPICFANANQTGYVYEPTFEQVVDMLKELRAIRPVPCHAVQFAGGEPTIYPRLFDVISKARELGFAQIQIATNGIKLAHDPTFAQRMLDAGMHTVYLQFDGLDDEQYLKTRGRRMLDIKMKAIENCRNTKPRPLSTVLVPTVVNGINDDQVGKILKFAVDNIDVIRGVVYQPVSFAGRISQKDRLSQRFTLTDLMDRCEEQTDFLKARDFYPVPVVVPESLLASKILGRDFVAFTAHPHCGIATYILVDDLGTPIPVTEFVDVDGLTRALIKLYNRINSPTGSLLIKKLKAVPAKPAAKLGRHGKSIGRATSRPLEKILGKYIDYSKTPSGIDMVEVLASIFSKGTKGAVGEFAWKSLLVSGMHFQDGYNYDIERVKRCVIHYVTPDPVMRIVPFCAYNGGHELRYEIERKYSIPVEEWKKQHGSADEPADQ